MNEEAFARIKNLTPVDAEPRISVDDGPDRTLLYGWSAAIDWGQNRTWHVYSEDGQLNLFVYGGPKPAGEIRIVDASEITRSELSSSTDSILVSGVELPAKLLPPRSAPTRRMRRGIFCAPDRARCAYFLHHFRSSRGEGVLRAAGV